MQLHFTEVTEDAGKSVFYQIFLDDFCYKVFRGILYSCFVTADETNVPKIAFSRYLI